ncbi:DapH/DapD/GlmU-related protein [Oceanisphaera ostreae]|uniref:DapH/DapD/GlmU-related protein n=1 Tax=Oceanisphaera ostreae TaxID=914151 RepID=A0ABW3KGE0_9GAMM
MSNSSFGAFFSSQVLSTQIISFLEEKYNCKLMIAGFSDVLLEGTCDSRNGGHRQLVFSNRDEFYKTKPLSESLVIIDEMPDESLQGNNQFCKVSDPRAAFMDILEWLIESEGLDAHRRGFTKTAAISNNVQVASSAVIEQGVEVGAGSIICAGVVLKAGTRIGENTVIRENVVIGSDGVTVYRAKDGRLLKFPHVAGVSIGDNSEIGANSVVAGGILSPTFIGKEAVIGNLCNIGHGAMVEDGVWISVGTLLGGHTKVHAGATIAMGVTVRDNLVIGEKASLGMGCVVVKSVDAGHAMFGNPAKRMIGLKTGPKR